MNLLKVAAECARVAGGGWLPAKDAQSLAAQMGMPEDQLMLALIDLAKSFAKPRISGFHVGAVGRGSTGALYFGGNHEFPGGPLNQTVHAEQAVVVNAQAHGECGLECLAISAAPCGFCRQFLYELVTAASLRVLLPNRSPQSLSALLPEAFGPSDLSVKGGMLAPAEGTLEWPKGPPDALAAAAFKAAQSSYAPYTKAMAGVALQGQSGRIYAGSYLENAAFNPSLLPLQAAMVALSLGEPNDDLPVAAAIVELRGSSLDHARAARERLASLTPSVSLNEFRVRSKGQTTPKPNTL